MCDLEDLASLRGFRAAGDRRRVRQLALERADDERNYLKYTDDELNAEALQRGQHSQAHERGIGAQGPAAWLRTGVPSASQGVRLREPSPRAGAALRTGAD